MKYRELEGIVQEALYECSDVEVFVEGFNFFKTIDDSIMDVLAVAMEIESLFREEGFLEEEIYGLERKSEEIVRKNDDSIKDVRREWEEIRGRLQGAMENLRKLSISLNEKIKQWTEKVGHAEQKATEALQEMQHFEENETEEMNAKNRRGAVVLAGGMTGFGVVVGLLVTATGLLTGGLAFGAVATGTVLGRGHDMFCTLKANNNNIRVAEERISVFREVIKPLLEPHVNALPPPDCNNIKKSI